MGGIPPEKIGDVLALMGDTSDNIPGVPGIGLKTAAQLIKEFGDLETLLARAGEIKQPKRRETLIANADKARLSKQLVTLDENAPLPVPLDELSLPEPDPRALVAFLRALEFNTLTRRVAAEYDVDPAEIEPDPRLLPGGEAIRWREGEGLPNGAGSTGGARPPARPCPFFGEEQAAAADEVDPFADLGLPEEGTPAAKPAPRNAQNPAALASARAVEAAAQAFDTSRLRDRHLAGPPSRMGRARPRDRASSPSTPRPTRSTPTGPALVGFSLAVEPGRAAYVPLRHRGDTDLFGGGLLPGQIPAEEALGGRPADPGGPLGPQDRAEPEVRLGGHEAARGRDRAYDDTMLMSYVLDAGRGGHGMDELARRHLGHTTISFADVAGTGRAKVTFDRVAIDKATAYAAEDVDVTLRLWRLLKPRLVAERRLPVYETLERGLVEVLARMELRGIKVDRAHPEPAVRRLRPVPRPAGGRDPRDGRRDLLASAARSRSATSCSARWACPAPRRRRPASGRRPRRCSRSSPPPGTSCRRRSWNGGSSPS